MKKPEQQVSFVESTGRLQICFQRSQESFQQVALVPAFGMSWNVTIAQWVLYIYHV